MKKAHIVSAILLLGIVGGVAFVHPALIIPAALGIAAVLAVELRPQ